MAFHRHLPKNTNFSASQGSVEAHWGSIQAKYKTGT